MESCYLELSEGGALDSGSRLLFFLPLHGVVFCGSQKSASKAFSANVNLFYSTYSVYYGVEVEQNRGEACVGVFFFLIDLSNRHINLFA